MSTFPTHCWNHVCLEPVKVLCTLPVSASSYELYFVESEGLVFLVFFIPSGSYILLAFCSCFPFLTFPTLDFQFYQVPPLLHSVL